MANKLNIEFEGFEEVISRLTQLESDTKKITEDALKKSKSYIHKNLSAAMGKHNKTFKTVRSLDSSYGVEWAGSVGTINVGFDLTKGGLPSIFLMYGTPRMKKDQKLYNAIYGKATRDEVIKIQEDLFYDELRRLNG